MKNTKFTTIAIMAILICACSSNQSKNTLSDVAYLSEKEYDEGMEFSKAAMDEAVYEIESSRDNQNYLPQTYISSSAAVENPNDTARRMIRTANIKFKVGDVIKATYNIENIVVKHSGFVENTNLESQINSRKEMRITEDSVLVSTYYTVVNTLVLRVPNTKLDTTLKEIAKLVDFMDYRVIQAKDVTLDLLTEKLKQSRLAKYDSRMKKAIDDKGKRLNDISDAENNLLYKQEQADEAKLANLRMLDKIKFSTLTLTLYQNQNIKYETIAKEKKFESYSTPFSTRFVDALKFGWSIIVEIFIFLVSIWSILLLVALVVFGIKYLKKRAKHKKMSQ